MKSKIACLVVAAAFLAGPSTCAEPAADLAVALASEDRAAADRARDAGRKPAEVVAFLGIGPGMTVMDLIAAGGYYTEVLSLAVVRPARSTRRTRPASCSSATARTRRRCRRGWRTGACRTSSG